MGDLKPADAEALARKYFERIPRGPKEPPDVVTLEVKQVAEKRMYAEADTNPQVDILWHTVAFQHQDSYALEILAQILSTRTGRLYKDLVLGSGVATEVYAQQDSRKWAGLFNAGGEVARRAHPRGGRASDLRESGKAQAGGSAARGIAEGEEQLRRGGIPPADLEFGDPVCT